MDINDKLARHNVFIGICAYILSFTFMIDPIFAALWWKKYNACAKTALIAQAVCLVQLPLLRIIEFYTDAAAKHPSNIVFDILNVVFSFVGLAIFVGGIAIVIYYGKKQNEQLEEQEGGN